MTDVSARLAADLADRYRLERELGQGGMATVYLAHDLKHDRQVAIKLLKPELGAVLGAERFLGEIRVTANLQHPNLLPLFDSGEAAGLLYYVMPYLEGETLRARLEREPQLPIDETVRLTTLLAGALDHAHARGVIHRDLKPENILLQAGQPVIADFGIALAVSNAGGTRVTETGLSVGTPHYMSPEQAAGDRAVDARSDQYALGVLAYEMLTGEPPHTGATAQVILARLMTETPRSVHATRPTVPPAMDTAILRALAKVPADRFASCGEFAGALTTATAPPSRVARGRRTPLLWAAAALVAAATVTSLLLRSRPTAPLPAIGRTIQVTRDPGLEIDPALSPDGTMLAYAQGTPTRMQVYVQQVSGGRRVALTSDSSDSFRSPRWSPDGTQLAFQGNDGVFVVPALGGPLRRVVRIDTLALSKLSGLGSGAVTPLSGIAWSPDGQRLAYVDILNAILVAPVAGGPSVRLARVPLPASPAWSPDGSWLAVSSGNPNYNFGTGYLGNVGYSSIWLVPVNGGPAIQVTDGKSLNVSPQWSADGRTLYWVSDRAGSRDIHLVDLHRDGTAAGPPRRLTTGLDVHGISLAADGTHLAYSSFRTFSNIWAVPLPGGGAVPAAPRPITTGNQTIEDADVSPDGEWLAFDSDRGGNPDIYRLATRGGEPLRLTTDSVGDFAPHWSRDGRQLVFHSFRTGNRDVFTMNADGTGLVQRTATPTQELDAVWAPADTALLFEAITDTSVAFQVLSLAGGRNALRLLALAGDFLEWSPTGEWVAYHAADGIRLASPAGGPSRLLVDNARDGGEAFLSCWAPDGKTLYYLSQRPTGWTIRAIPLDGGPSRPLVTFDDPARQPTRYGFATDGRDFYVTLGSHESDVWVMELERR